MIPAARLEDLTSPLPADLLFLFVCGPGGQTGKGAEALALALPGQGWLTVDSCKVGLDLPQELIIARWRRSPADSLLASVLTHPHDDHAAGLGDLLDRLRPPVVAVTGNPPPEQDLARRVQDLLSSGVTSRDIAAGTVRAALSAMERLVSSGATRLAPIRDGEILIPGPATVRCLAPTSSEIRDLLGHLPKERANELSAVLEVTWGATRLLLGADLPWKSPGSNKVLTSGWDSVEARHPGLATHQGLKVPHHGSREALHPGLLGSAGATPRLWVCTPFERSDLPRMDPGDGVDQLLAAEPRLHLTKRPHVRAKASSATLSIGTLRPPSGVRLYSQAPPDDPLDAVWCFAFDATGQLVGRWRGDAAVEVIP